MFATRLQLGSVEGYREKFLPVLEHSLGWREGQTTAIRLGSSGLEILTNQPGLAIDAREIHDHSYSRASVYEIFATSGTIRGVSVPNPLFRDGIRSVDFLQDTGEVVVVADYQRMTKDEPVSQNPTTNSHDNFLFDLVVKIQTKNS